MISARRALRIAGITALVGACAGAGALLPSAAPAQERRIQMKARQYAYDPPVLRVNKGDTVRLRIESKDVIHGFFLEAFDINASIIPDSPYLEVTRPSRPGDPLQKMEEIVFVADKTGKFRFRCSRVCGNMHPFMQGELVVAPNRVAGAAIGACFGLLAAAAFVALRPDPEKP